MLGEGERRSVGVVRKKRQYEPFETVNEITVSTRKQRKLTQRTQWLPPPCHVHNPRQPNPRTALFLRMHVTSIPVAHYFI